MRINFVILELLNCEYYVTSEVTYGDYFEFQNSTRFYTVTPNTIKFILTSSENDAERHEIGIQFFKISFIRIFCSMYLFLVF